jgi:hypothetical protein
MPVFVKSYIALSGNYQASKQALSIAQQLYSSAKALISYVASKK